MNHPVLTFATDLKQRNFISQIIFQVFRLGTRRVLREQRPRGHSPLLSIQPVEGAGQEARGQGQLGKGQGRTSSFIILSSVLWIL